MQNNHPDQESIVATEPAPAQTRKTWVSPVVSPSPVNALTASASNIVWDGAGYS